ncbi:MAG: biotin attachment protein [Caulobacteraceae bacterium]|jgi:pyruvate/2-oxoglutarate dehydrogenase complex dihydrolipoamide acyltransferase (E2) component|nr:biotin attachment protein [Caulobacteraceae bacterium]
MKPIRIDERLWNTAAAPEGILEWWFRLDGARVAVGEKLAQVQIGGALHDVTSPAAGQLRILAFTGSVLDPGSVIGQVIPA